MASKVVAEEFPLQWAVWHNDPAKLAELLDTETGAAEIEKLDPRGRTPLMLAVTLGRLECSNVLLNHGANATVDNRGYWSVAHEAVSTGDPELLQLILQHRDHQRAEKMKQATSNLLKKLKDTPDFYAEMRWEFTSWLPFVSRICPSDTYKVYKSGSFVRIDTTLVGFDAAGQWERGDQSFVFKASEDGKWLEVAVVDHKLKSCNLEKLKSSEGEADEEDGPQYFKPSPAEVSARLTSPIVTTYVDMEKIAFERSKGGLLWSKDKEEVVNGHNTKVFSASQVELVTKTRSEHLTERDKAEQDSRNSTPMDSLLKFVQGTEIKEEQKGAGKEEPVDSLNPNGITPDEYLNALIEWGPNKDIGRPKQTSKRAQTFKAHLWLAPEFPLDLQEQIAPIIDLMAANNAHFARLQNFIQLQLPAGFPVKIEIPLFHVVNAKITFGNIFGLEHPVEHVKVVVAEEEATGKSEAAEGGEELPPESPKRVCVIDSCVFDIPDGYGDMGGRGTRPGLRPHPPGIRQYHPEDDDALLQWAIQQSLRTDSDQQETFPPFVPQRYGLEEDGDLQRALELSLRQESSGGGGGEEGEERGAIGGGLGTLDQELQLALELSLKEEEERKRRLEEAEEEELRKAIQLSMADT